jgi:hypothetical protein
MFRPTLQRFRAWVELADDLLGDAPEADSPALAQLHIQSHPHRRPLRWERSRRPGSVAPAPASCLSPVRPARGGHDRSEHALS